MRGGKGGRQCDKGKSCGATCIERRKVCLIEVGKEVARSLPRAANAVNRRGMNVAQEIKYLENKRTSLVDNAHALLSKDRGDGKGSHFENPNEESFKILRKLGRDTERIDARLNRLEGRPLRVFRGPDGKEISVEPKRWYPDRFNLDDRFKDNKSEVRERYNQKILNDALKQGSKGNPPEAIFTMGGPGSGKTTLMDKLLEGRKGFVHVDPDAIRTLLPEYLFGIAMGYQGIANTTNASAGILSVRLAGLAREKGLNMAWDGTGANRFYFEKSLRDFKDAGYRVQITAQQVPVAEGIKRAVIRSELPISMGGGRIVPVDFIKQAYINVPINFPAMAKIVDSASITDGMVGKEIMRYEGGKVVSEDSKLGPAFRNKYGEGD